MHRSGTSVITQLLGIAGARLPADLIGATKDNEYGHWEPVWLNDRNAIRADVRWMDIDSDAKLNGASIGTAEIDPVVVGVSYIWKF